jgi:hypothetical protein
MAHSSAMTATTTTIEGLTEFTVFPKLPIEVRRRIFGCLETPYRETHIHAIRGFPQHILKDKVRDAQKRKLQYPDRNRIFIKLTPHRQNPSSLPHPANSNGPTPISNGPRTPPLHTLLGTCKGVASSPPPRLESLPFYTHARNRVDFSSKSTTSFTLSARFSTSTTIFCSLMHRLRFTMLKSAIRVLRHLQSFFIILS